MICLETGSDGGHAQGRRWRQRARFAQGGTRQEVLLPDAAAARGGATLHRCGTAPHPAGPVRRVLQRASALAGETAGRGPWRPDSHSHTLVFINYDGNCDLAIVTERTVRPRAQGACVPACVCVASIPNVLLVLVSSAHRQQRSCSCIWRCRAPAAVQLGSCVSIWLHRWARAPRRMAD